MAWERSSGDLARGWDLAPDPASGAKPTEDDGSTIVPLLGDVQGLRMPYHSTIAHGSEAKSAGSLGFSLHLDPLSRAGGLGSSGRATIEPLRDSAPPFPEPGETIGGFRLISELGRGAFARVYLAEQAELADRPVALKVSRPSGAEPQVLARLQHTNIVPIHSVLDDPASGLRLLCMPYVGGANLGQVLHRAGGRMPSEATGLSLVEALDAAAGEALALAPAASRANGASRFASGYPGRARYPRAVTRGVGTPSAVRSIWGRYLAHLPTWRSTIGPQGAGVSPDEPEPARRFLRAASYIQAAAWIAARLAEALEHAHERGILHRDLKPSNVLIAADGTPMLLDFNLSADSTVEIDDPVKARAMLGGTLPYMAPEHLDAFNPSGTTAATEVDERSDIYSLGLILFEMVAGRHPFDDPAPGIRLAEVLRMLTEQRRRGAPAARTINPLVPPSLDAILQKCLDPEPGRRYGCAGELAEDLRRFLDDRPLKFTREPSVRERAAKWARRNPWACSLTSIGGAAAVVVLALGLTLWVAADRLSRDDARLRRGELSKVLGECQLLLNTSAGPEEHLKRGIAEARQALDRYGADRPGWVAGPLLRRLPAGEQAEVRRELSELVQLVARAEVHRAGDGPRRRQALEESVAWLDRAERFDPSPPAALFTDRAAYLEALGLHDRAAADRALAARTPPRDARDYYLSGTALLAAGRLDAAEVALSRAVALSPRRFWSWFALGLCHERQGRHAEAAGEFGTCTVLSPEFAWPHLNRGLSLAAAGRLVEARAAYDRAIAANPDFAEARVDRALVCLQMGQPGEALLDLDHAVKLGRLTPRVMAARGEALARLGRRDDAARAFDAAVAAAPNDPVVRVARGFALRRDDPVAAAADFRWALKLNDRDARARLGLAYLLRPTAPADALDQLDQALAADPALADARELRALIRARRGDIQAESDVDLMIATPTRHRLFNAACALSILSEKVGDERLADRALSLLVRAIDAGFPKAEAKADPDLRPISDRPAFRVLLDGE